MPRRKSHPHEELPFVALMDTMTNVVGVLIIVLVMIGIGLANSVRKVLSDLPPVTPAEFEKLNTEVTDAAPKEDPKKLEDDAEKLQKDLKLAVEQLKTMDLTTDAQKSKVMDLDELTRQLEDRKKQRDLKKAEVDKLLAEMEKLKARLEVTPVYQPPAATIVKLPNPRPMPEKAVVQRFLIAGGRIIFTNDEEFARLVEQEIDKNGKALIHSDETVKGADGKPVMIRDKFGRLSPQRKTIYDPKKLSEHFSRQRVGTRELKLELIPLPNSPRIPVKLTPAPDAGESIEQAKNPASVYQRLLRKFKSEPNTVVWFHVFKDSIETYLAARDLADQTGVPVGWEIYGNNFYQRLLSPQYLVNFTPAKPAAPTTTPPAVVIAPPKTTLD